jgi:hypothetical protein
MRPFTVYLEGLVPERFGLLVRTISVTRGPGGVSGAASMNDHRVVPRGETACHIERFTGAGCIPN